MTPISLLAAALLLSAVTGFAAARLGAPAAGAPPPPRGEEVARLAEALAGIEDRQSALAADVEGLRADIASRELGLERSQAGVPLAEIEAAVARALERRDAPAEGLEPGGRAAAPRQLDARSAFEALLAPDLSREDAEKKWREIADAGLFDEVIALFEQRAKDHPKSAQAQIDFGSACLKKSVRLIGTQEGYGWVVKGDKCFDAALAIDDHNWSARFQKATGLSFWPPVMGKQAEAIRHFEILAAQQEGAPLHSGFAKTYLFLGNLYLQSGDEEKALATWKKGFALFPDDAELRTQIVNSQQH